MWIDHISAVSFIKCW